MASINQLAPEFSLLDLQGKLHTLHEKLGQIVIVNFWSAGCPHAARVDAELANYMQSWRPDVALVSIASNANEPPDLLTQVAAQRGLSLVLLDPEGKIADLYGAMTTPHLFVVDPAGILRYQGAVDDVTFRQRMPTRHYLRDAIESIIDGALPEPAETQAYGCAIVRFAR
jgi:peroxiredoxin